MICAKERTLKQAYPEVLEGKECPCHPERVPVRSQREETRAEHDCQRNKREEYIR